MLAWYATAFPLDASAPQSAKTHYVAIVSLIAAVAIIALIAFAFMDHFERRRDKKERQRLNMMVAEMHEAQTSKSDSKRSGQIGQAVGMVVNPTIAESVKNGDVFTRFHRENITLLRTAGLRLAKLYRDFAARPVDKGEISSGKYMTDFWEQFPFGELDAIKERLSGILGVFNVASAAEELPSQPDRIKKLAKNLENEALKIREDVPL